MIKKKKTQKNKSSMVRRIILFSMAVSLITVILTFFIFKKNPIYCIIYLLGSVISIAGFWILSRMINLYIDKSKGQGMYFLVGLAKMVVITAAFYLAAQVSKTAVLLFILGLLVTIAAIFIEAVYQLSRRIPKWKTIKS